MQYIYNFPELRPSVWAGNMDWFRAQQTFQTKLSELQGVQRIVVNGPFYVYKELQDKFQTRCGLPIVPREEVGPCLPSNTLALYFVEYPTSLEQFTQDFGLQIGEYGKILPLE
jgi:hypothetical protein